MRRPLMKIVGVLETSMAKPFEWLASTCCSGFGAGRQALNTSGFRPICEA